LAWQLIKQLAKGKAIESRIKSGNNMLHAMAAKSQQQSQKASEMYR